MDAIRKKIVTDEESRPVAVQIDYADWLEIEELLRRYGEQPRTPDLSRYAGSIQLTEDPLAYQSRMRGDWA